MSLRNSSSTATDPPAHRLTAFWLVLTAAGLRLASLGAYPLTDATDARYAELARKMLETGNWIMPQYDYGVPFWGKPPLAVWLTALGMRLFGVNEFAARLPHFLLCVGTGALVFAFARAERGTRLAWSATAIFATSALVAYVSGAALTDPALCFAVTLAMSSFWRALNAADSRRANRWAGLGFGALGLGLLVKGPVALALTGLPIAAWCLQSGAVTRACRTLPIARGIAVMLAIALPWYLAAEYASPGFLDYFLVGENWRRFVHAGWSGDLYGGPHQEARGTIWLFALGATLPWSLLLAWRWRALRGAVNRAPAHRAWRRYVVWWALGPLLIFTFAGNIVWTYVLPGVPAFALYAAEYLGDDAHLAFVGPVRPWALALTAMLAVMLPWNWRFDSEKPLVAGYLAARGDRAATLLYGWERPYSAEFYTRGTALKVSPETLQAALQRRALEFVALPEHGILDGAIQVPSDYQRIADSERFTLYRRKPAVAR